MKISIDAIIDLYKRGKVICNWYREDPTVQAGTYHDLGLLDTEALEVIRTASVMEKSNSFGVLGWHVWGLDLDMEERCVHVVYDEFEDVLVIVGVVS